MPLREKLSKINEQFKIYANEYITAKQVIVSTKEGADVGGGGNPKVRLRHQKLITSTSFLSTAVLMQQH